MSARVILVRHGSHDLLGKVLCGRMDGVGLNAAGAAQAEAVARRLGRQKVAAVYTSPRERCRQTAARIGAALDQEPVVAEALDEIDFGTWNGASFADLEGMTEWDAWNAARGSARPPDGESMAEVADRLVAWLDDAGRRHADATVVAVSHADVIKAALCTALGLPLDRYDRFDVDPGSMSAVVVGRWGMRVQGINEAAA